MNRCYDSDDEFVGDLWLHFSKLARYGLDIYIQSYVQIINPCLYSPYR